MGIVVWDVGEIFPTRGGLVVVDIGGYGRYVSVSGAAIVVFACCEWGWLVGRDGSWN